MSEQPDPADYGFKCIPGHTWEYTAAVLKYALDQMKTELAHEQGKGHALALEVLNLRDQLHRANATIDHLTKEA